MQAHKMILWICLVLMAAVNNAEARPQILEAIGEGIGSIFEGIGEGIGDAFEGVGEFVETLTRPRPTNPVVPPGAGIPLPPPTGPNPAFQPGGLNNIGAGGSPSTFQLGPSNIGAGGPPSTFQLSPSNIAGPPPPSFQQPLNNVGGGQIV